jgi:preprotein translocase subunit SecA
MINLKFGFSIPYEMVAGDRASSQEGVFKHAVQEYERKELAVGGDLLRYMERMVFLQIIDSKWKDHLYAMDKLREGIGLRAYGHRDP